MGEIGNPGSDARPNLVCLEGNGSRPSHQGNGWRECGTMYTLNTTEVHGVAYEVIAIEHHPNDSRIKVSADGLCQSLTSRMGTGGNNVPLVMFVKSSRAKTKDDCETWVEGKVANTLNTFDNGEVRATALVVTRNRCK